MSVEHRLRQVGSALSADGVRPETRRECYSQSGLAVNQRKAYGQIWWSVSGRRRHGQIRWRYGRRRRHGQVRWRYGRRRCHGQIRWLVSAPEAPRSNSVVSVGAGGATVNSRGRSPRYLPPNTPAPKGPRMNRGPEPQNMSRPLGECAAIEQATRILMLKTVLLGPFGAGIVGGRYRGLRPRLLTVAPPAPQSFPLSQSIRLRGCKWAG